MIKYFENAKQLQNLLTKQGFKTLACGGYVRDYLLNLPYKDIDLATQATPEQMKVVFEKFGIKYIETGLKHGTITAVVNRNHFEITTLRKDIKCLGRKAEVDFVVSFEEDAKRRDFTINAMFMDLNTMEITDYVGGLEDIKRKSIHLVGNSEDRIKEDYLRILRAFRFEAQLHRLGFTMGVWTRHYTRKHLTKIHFISIERIREELLKMIVHPSFDKANLELILCTVIPELTSSFLQLQNCRHHFTNVGNHTLTGLKHLAQFKDPVLSMAFLLHDVAKPFCHSKDECGIDHFYRHEIEGERIAGQICEKLKFSTKDKKRIKFLIRHHMYFHINTKTIIIKRMLSKCEAFGNKELIFDILKMLKADYQGMRHDLLENSLQRINCLEQYAKERIKKDKLQSPLDGRNILDFLGLTEGKEIGEIKNYLKNLVIEGTLKVDDKKQALIMAKKYLKGQNNEKDKS